MKSKLSLICAWMLMSCMTPSREGGPGDPSAEFGQATLILPAITPSVLAKPGQNLGSFTLEISGTGMAPMNFTFMLDGMSGKPVVISRIPAGARRLFTGRLLDAQGMITHEGSAPAAIEAGKTAEVRLLLLSKHTGNANICVEVEGMPPPANCIKPPDSVKVAGCWNLSETSGIGAKIEYYAAAREGFMGMVMRLDGKSEPITTWHQANGALTFIVIGQGGLKRIYTGWFDSPASGLTGVRGQVTDAASNKLLGDWKAYPTPCAPAPVVTNCWEVVKTSAACIRSRGFIKMTQTGNLVQGNMGYRSGFSTLQGKVEGGSLKFLAVSEGVPRDSVEYSSQILAGNGTMSGKYRALNGTEFGEWRAAVDSTCRFTFEPDERTCAILAK